MTRSLVTAKNICRTELVLKMTRTKKANEERSVDRKMMLKRRILTDSLCSTGGPAMSVGISMRALLHRRTRNVSCHVNEGYTSLHRITQASLYLGTVAATGKRLYR